MSWGIVVCGNIGIGFGKIEALSDCNKNWQNTGNHKAVNFS